MNKKLLGITVMPEYYQTEGIDAVLDHLVHKAGATAVTTSPYVLAEADSTTGSREPPDDAGAGAVRLLDRPLWGKRELFVTAAPSFTPEVSFYRGLRYQPPPPTPLTKSDGRIVREFLDAAQGRHLKVYLQVQAAIPPGYRVQFGGPEDDDLPRLPDSKIAKRRLAKNGSLASPNIRSYLSALLRDLIRVYPYVDGFRIDWPEYPPYLLSDAFFDFSLPARAAATRLGFDFVKMRDAALAFYQTVHGLLTDDLLRGWSLTEGCYGVLRRLTRYPAIGEWLDFKAALVADFVSEVRATLDALTPPGRRYELVPNAFPPPMTLASGFDFHRTAPFCDGASMKLYSMHWPMIVNFWARELMETNPGLKDEELLVRSLVALFDIPPDADAPQRPYDLQTYAYPEPDAPHPVGSETLRRKIRQARAEADGAMPIFALAHGYGPVDDFRRRLAACWETADGVWINRYAYLSDAKLQAVGEVCR
jgi:hypothetical protein